MLEILENTQDLIDLPATPAENLEAMVKLQQEQLHIAQVQNENLAAVIKIVDNFEDIIGWFVSKLKT